MIHNFILTVLLGFILMLLYLYYFFHKENSLFFHVTFNLFAIFDLISSYDCVIMSSFVDLEFHNISPQIWSFQTVAWTKLVYFDAFETFFVIQVGLNVGLYCSNHD